LRMVRRISGIRYQVSGISDQKSVISKEVTAPRGLPAIRCLITDD
jgi:hypothetical protein